MGRRAAAVPRFHRAVPGEEAQEEDHRGAGSPAPVAAEGGTSHGERRSPQQRKHDGHARLPKWEHLQEVRQAPRAAAPARPVAL